MGGLLLVGLAGRSTASQPYHFQIGFPPFPLPAPGLSAACGFDVSLQFDGVARGTLFFDSDGTPIHEIDQAAGVTVTLISATETLTSPLASFHTEYLGDADGSPAIVSLAGFTLDPRGRAAGRLVFEAAVVGFDPNSVPITDTSALTSADGHFTDTEALCEALT